MVKSLERALDLLEVISLHGGKMTLAAITKEMPINKSTAYRILTTFVQKQVLNKDPATAEYSLANKAFLNSLVKENNFDLYNYAKDEMSRLSNKHELPINLSIIDQQNTQQGSGKIMMTIQYYQDQVETNTLLTIQQCIASRIFQPAVYLCFMAFGPEIAGTENYLENYFKLNRRRLKPKKTYEEFQVEIKEIQTQHYALCHGEYNHQESCLAFPILNQQGVIIGALSFSFDTKELGKLLSNGLINELIFTTKSIASQWSLDN